MTFSQYRRHAQHLSALVVTSLLMAGVAQAQPDTGAEPIDRSILDAAQGEYLLDDGRALNLRLRSRHVEIRIDEQNSQRWLPASATVLVSPDGRQRLHLHRDHNGHIDRVSLESPRKL